jgi:SAM-dependent methyltransferase
VAGTPVLLPSAEQHVALWRRQLGLLLERGQRTLTALTDAASDPRLADATRARLAALGRAAKSQVDDVASILGPALGGALAAEGSGLPRGVVEYIGYLYRDWGWPAAGYQENEPALAELGQLLGARELGRMLVFGAGACGLAYELHLRHGASETVALDIDPYLLVIAERVARGESVRLTEASLKWIDGSEVSRQWQLKAARGPLAREVFHCVFADGLAPPFASESFDTVVTPWFIDQVPRDLPAFLRTLHELLRPGGRWLNQGPLVYPEQTPFERRYAREELFELARAEGFAVGDWSAAQRARPALAVPAARWASVVRAGRWARCPLQPMSCPFFRRPAASATHRSFRSLRTT